MPMEAKVKVVAGLSFIPSVLLLMVLLLFFAGNRSV